VYRADGRRLDGDRRFSFTLLPYEVPAFSGDASTRPESVGCFVELRATEPIELEGERLSIVTADNHRVRFHLFAVSDTPPYCHTTIVDSWPEIIGADVHVTLQAEHRRVTA